MNVISFVGAAVLCFPAPPDGLVVTREKGKCEVAFRPIGPDKPKQLTAEQHAWICEQPRIDYLNVASSQVTIYHLREICQHVDLRGISIADNHLNPKALQILASEKHLSRLNLDASGHRW